MLPADGAFYGFIDFIGKVEEWDCLKPWWC
jgi:hypothetical protein